MSENHAIASPAPDQNHECEAADDGEAAVVRLTQEALAIGADRARQLKALRASLRAGSTQREAAAFAGVSDGQASKLLRNWQHLSDDEVTAENLAGATARCGRRSPWDAIAQSPEVRRALQHLYLLTIGASAEASIRGRRTGSAALTLERFADHALCPPELARALRLGQQPKPLLAVIRQLTPEMEARHRGPRHAMLGGSVVRRTTLVEVLRDGSRQAITAGDWWVFDDASDNQPFWFEVPDQNDQPVALIGRQGLYAYDVTHRWLGLELLGTPRDSYTAATILRFIRRLMESYGRPRRGVVFEQSVWAAKAIKGFRLTTSGAVVEDEYDRDRMPDADAAMIQDGLRALGIEVHYARTPRGKEIEGAFNYLQRVAPTFSPDALNIGRHRGEFEHAAKQLRRAHSGVAHPRDLGFASIEQRADVLTQAMEWIIARGAWQDDVEAKPEPYPALAQLSTRDRAAFLPHSAELLLRGGRVTTTVAGRPFDFCAPELFAEIGTGYRLFIRFDSAEPTLGAAIYNRETGSANHRGWQVGEFMGWAEYLPPVARFDWTDAEDPAAQLKARHSAYVRTAYRAVGLGHKASTARDGSGRVAVVTNHLPVAEVDRPRAGQRSPRPDAPVVTSRRATRRASAQSSAPERDPRLAEFYEDDVPTGP